MQRPPGQHPRARGPTRNGPGWATPHTSESDRLFSKKRHWSTSAASFSLMTFSCAVALASQVADTSSLDVKGHMRDTTTSFYEDCRRYTKGTFLPLLKDVTSLDQVAPTILNDVSGRMDEIAQHGSILHVFRGGWNNDTRSGGMNDCVSTEATGNLLNAKYGALKITDQKRLRQEILKRFKLTENQVKEGRKDAGTRQGRDKYTDWKGAALYTGLMSIHVLPKALTLKFTEGPEQEHYENVDVALQRMLGDQMLPQLRNLRSGYYRPPPQGTFVRSTHKENSGGGISYVTSVLVISTLLLELEGIQRTNIEPRAQEESDEDADQQSDEEF